MADERKFLGKCVGCGGYKPKSEFIKITADSKSGEIFINPLNNIYGRSCYICKDENCVNTAFKKDRISKILKKRVNVELKNKIIVLLHK